ncbi:hypothetical protein G6F61_000713 [Rhizopus arrhizus]|nr:hypothetical protein G6F24_000760 [Rhizopus arrhizus]KAG1384162.1 hypothetical protein G6F61_000713 [Rhizopus arrhizus]
MVYKSKLKSIEEPKIGIIQFIFSNKYNTPESKPILIDALNPKRHITYGQLKELVLQFAAGLQDVCGFTSNDVLALYAPNQYNYSVPLLGGVAANGAVTTANPNYNVQELTYQLEQTNAKVIICHEENLDTALAAAQKVNIPKKNIFIFGDKPIKGVQPFQTALIKQRKATLVDLSYKETKEKVAYLCFSSGTTGKSKGVMTTHSNMTSNVCQFTSFEDEIIDKNTDKMICVLPLFHIFGLMAILHVGLYWGLPVYVLPRFEFTKFCETIQEHKITYGLLVPPIFLLLAKSPIVKKYDLSSLRISLSGAAPLSGDLIREVRERLPTLIITQAYGLTETTPCAIAEPTYRTIDGSIGILISNMLAKVVDEDGNEVPQGEKGELWLKGPNIMKGYINNPEAIADCIDNEGYFHTGDIVVVDKNEHFFVVDRLKELIKYKGFQVPPAELEGILLKSPIIADCAVVGVYDSAQLAEKIMKYITDETLRFKHMRSVYVINDMPKRPADKALHRIFGD